VICCTTCEQPRAGLASRSIADVRTNPTPGSMEDFQELIAELGSLVRPSSPTGARAITPMEGSEAMWGLRIPMS
jgi:hypothetical protein